MKAVYRGVELGYELTHGRSHGDYDQMYGPSVVDVRGATVLDIGADEGSTADYFFQQGAALVMVSEVDPELVARLEAWEATEPRLWVLWPMRSVADVAEWIGSAPPGPLVVKMDADLGNDVPGGMESHLLDMPLDVLGLPDAWVIETHSPEVHGALWECLESAGYTVRLVRAWRSNPNVKVIAARRA